MTLTTELDLLEQRINAEAERLERTWNRVADRLMEMGRRELFWQTDERDATKVPDWRGGKPSRQTCESDGAAVAELCRPASGPSEILRGLTIARCKERGAV